MMKKKFTTLALFITLAFSSNYALAFKDGFVLTLRADFLGSLTLPKISKKELTSLGGANKMEGMAGFIMGCEAELGYIFNAKEFMGLFDDYYFTGIGWNFNIGVGEGHIGQISGSIEAGKPVNVYVNVYSTPVISLSTGSRIYLFSGRMALGTTFGLKMYADPSPTYQMYTDRDDLGDTLGPPVGTVIVDDFARSHMNPFTFHNKYFIEYNQPIVERMEMALRLFIGYNIYKPGYATLPTKQLINGAKAKPGVQKFDPKRKLDSFYLNNMEFGLSLALNFKG